MTRWIAALALAATTMTGCWAASAPGQSTPSSTGFASAKEPAPAPAADTDDDGLARAAIGALVIVTAVGLAAYAIDAASDDPTEPEDCHEPFGYWQPDNGQPVTYCH